MGSGYCLGMKSGHLAVLALGLAACGPTDQEVGVAVLSAMPAIVAGGWLLQLLYRMAWRTLDPDLPSFEPRPSGILFAASVALALVWAQDLSDETFMALWLAGASYAGVLMIAGRLTLRSALYSWAAIVPWLLSAPVAALLAAVGSDTGEADGWLAYFVFPGCGGLVSGALVVALFSEVLVRLHLERKRARAQEPVFPEARIHGE